MKKRTTSMTKISKKATRTNKSISGFDSYNLCLTGEPIICFEPGIVKREGSDSRFVADMCGTLRAEMGDNQPAVCYERNQCKMSESMGSERDTTV